MSFVKVKDVLPKIADMSEESQAMEAAFVVEVVNGKIGEIFGEKAVGNVKAVRYKSGVLTLGVRSGAWGQEVRMRSAAMHSFFVLLLPNHPRFKIYFTVFVS